MNTNDDSTLSLSDRMARQYQLDHMGFTPREIFAVSRDIFNAGGLQRHNLIKNAVYDCGYPAPPTGSRNQ
jgi:hypothetical protein